LIARSQARPAPAPSPSLSRPTWARNRSQLFDGLV